MIGQRGPVWFLAGARSGEPVTRRCSIPEGVALFFPVINTGFVYVPDCGDPNLSCWVQTASFPARCTRRRWTMATT
jgi:hypothetical protein